MRRDVNILLLLLIVVSALAFTGFSVYYQTTFKNVSQEYQNKLEQLTSVTDELTTQRQKLNETYSLRVKAEQDRSALDTQYQGIVDESEQLKDDKARLQTDVLATKQDLQRANDKLGATENLLSQTQAELSQAKAQRDNFKRDLASVCNELVDSGGNHPDC